MSELDINEVTRQWRFIMEETQSLENLLTKSEYDEFLKLTEARLEKIERFFNQFETEELPAALMETILSDIERIRGQDAKAMEIFSRDQSDLVELMRGLQSGKKGIKQYQQS